ncbi:MAG: 50S ribosomal protein L21e [Thermoplasmata archaeon]
MSQMSRGPRARSGMKLMKSVREKGMVQITRSLRRFDIGDRVAIDIEPSIHKGMPHHRFQGLVGIIAGKQGSAYIVELNINRVKKKIIAMPVHLKKV